MMTKAEANEIGATNYMRRVPGTAGNHERAIEANVHAEGYVGINQYEKNGAFVDGVLLTPEQWAALVRFVREETPPVGW